MKERIAIVEGLRTPFCKAMGAISQWQADDLGVFALKELLARSPVSEEEVDEVIIGNCIMPPHAGNIARVVALKAGMPESCPAYTVHRNCASGMEALTTAANKMLAGEGKIIAVGGTESMSNTPLLYNKQATGFFGRMMGAKTLMQKVKAFLSLRPQMFFDPVIGLKLGLTDPVSGLIMGKTAENLARDYHIGRLEQDSYAVESHRKAVEAQKAGRLAQEICPIPLPEFKGYQEEDQGPRENQSLQQLAKLKTIFDRDAGTVTPGNACQVTDGAVMLMTMLESEAKARGLKPLGYMRDYAFAGCEPARMGLGPVNATARLCKEGGFKLSDFELFEINEAFAVQVMGCLREFEKRGMGTIDESKLNVNGGAIALGHPVGSSGARLVLTLLKEMHRRGNQLGLATLCVGGGQGAAIALEVE